MTPIDFEEIVPPRPVYPDRPQCEYQNSAHHTYAKRCGSKSTHRIDGKHYCRPHAAQAALKYLERLSTAS